MASILEIDSKNLTPGMKQYQEVKQANPDCIIMLRMGDFYELFYEDAITASKELEITLTSRGKGDKQAPLAGIPYHALDSYLGRLVKKGYKVAIVEQLENPKEAKGLVKRGLVRIVTPGTVIESSMLNEKYNNYIAAVTARSNSFSIAYCDLSTGEFCTSSFDHFESLLDELARLNASECIIPESLKVNSEIVERLKSKGHFLNTQNDFFFTINKAKEILTNHFNLNSLGLPDQNLAVSGGLIKYLQDTQKNSLSHFRKISLKSNEKEMLLDSSTLKNLELLKNIKDGGSATLLSVLDKTVTPMGARLLKKWLQAPLLQKTLIEKRLQAVSDLHRNVIAREEIILLLDRIYDLERLISRINYGNASPRDLLALKHSLQQLPLIKSKLEFKSELLKQISEIDTLPEITELLDKSIREDAPITIREGNIIKSTYHQELAELHSITKNSKQYLAELEEKEKQNSGINSLKISYNRIFGYYIEITKKNIHLVPSNYIRKQTTANSERYITEDLKIQEEKILGAQEKIEQMEYNLFQEIIKKISLKTSEIQRTANRISVLDVLCCLAKVAMENNYIMPNFVNENIIQIKSGRHPVIEKIESQFIANDVFLNENEIMIITGPNTSGKSTIMRQTALIVLMAQIGSFVPAEKCILGITDRIFTRVGAQDDLSSGQSTFMVEMLETANILNNATSRSLIILDEIGRGTSTFDGVAIAWSVAEHIYNKIKAKTMFATHYHIMNKLAENFEGINNYNVAVTEVDDELIYLRKLIPGGTDQSHGIHVAKMAGLPDKVLERAKEIQELLEKDDTMVNKIKVNKLEQQKSLDSF
ncbi:MAG TPA: DNA mismatch repair protein MutS [Candidatus Nanoarchaeia archaeon]|nr:DNA mismatch repair protein MutS [Candidatus Nanoarchaeia archaeon]